MKYAQVASAVSLVALLVGACAFDEGGYPSEDPTVTTPDPGDPISPVDPTGPDPTGNCSDDDGDGFFAQPDCGGLVDCDDADKDVFPGQATFYAAAAANNGFDYNCDGTDEREFSVKADENRCVSGWKKNPPRCGDEKNFVMCTLEDPADDECDCDDISVTQRCR